MNDAYEAVIGLEVHVELATATKAFCACKNAFADAPNTNVCPVCMGLPGTLPTLNAHALDLTVAAGLATGCEIAEYTRFDRKNYFYPDLPKAYQISQYEHPVCVRGSIDIGTRKIEITRIHLEEDAGKLVHTEGGTQIDYNRCGVPLIEIVSEPQIHSADEARAYLSELRTRLIYAGVSDCKMQEGSFRCDVNLSVRKRGESALGVRTEMKNINSFAFVARAIEYEFARQVSVLESGGKVLPETRRFDSQSGKTHAMRIKETASDYRFLPEPDLKPLHLARQRVDFIRRSLPVMPDVRRKKYVEIYGLRESDARIIAARLPLAEYFEGAAEGSTCVGTVANILLTHLLGESGADGFECAVTPHELAEVAALYAEQTVNSSTVKRLLALVADSHTPPRELVRSHSLAQINDRELLASMLEEVLCDNPKLLADYQNGKKAAEKAIIGKVMSQSGGRANPVILNDIWRGRADAGDAGMRGGAVAF